MPIFCPVGFVRNWSNGQCVDYQTANLPSAPGDLTAGEAEDLRGCFYLNQSGGVPNQFIPQGMDQADYSAFCLRSLADLKFDYPFRTTQGGEQLGPPPDCVPPEMQSRLSYCAASGAQGNDPALNYFCWSVLKDPDNFLAWASRPPCPGEQPSAQPQCLDPQQAVIAAPCFYVNRATGVFEGDPEELLAGADPVQFAQFCVNSGYTTNAGFFAQPLCDPNFTVPAPPSCLSPEHRAVLTSCQQSGFRGDDPIANYFCWLADKAPARFQEWLNTPDCPPGEVLPPPGELPPPPAAPPLTCPPGSIFDPMANACASCPPGYLFDLISRLCLSATQAPLPPATVAPVPSAPAPVAPRPSLAVPILIGAAVVGAAALLLSG